MSEHKITWTEDELREFDDLAEMNSSRNQMDRINARIDMHNFVERHGKEKCDAMWTYLECKVPK